MSGDDADCYNCQLACKDEHVGPQGRARGFPTMTIRREEDLDCSSATACPRDRAPRVSYRNIPGRFIAGTVYDPVAKEVIIGARCLLTSGGKVVETFTDAYGDFWFKDLPAGTYSVSIEAKGFKGKYFSGLTTAKDVNLGDVGMERKSGGLPCLL